MPIKALVCVCAPLAFHPLPLFLSFFPLTYTIATLYTFKPCFFFSLLFFSRLFVFAPGSQCTSSTLFKLKSYNSHFVIHQRDSLPRDPMFLFSRVQNSRYTNWKILMRHLFSCTGEREKKKLCFFSSLVSPLFHKRKKKWDYNRNGPGLSLDNKLFRLKGKRAILLSVA